MTNKGILYDSEQLKVELLRHRLPSVIVFNEEFISETMEQGRTSVVLFTSNVRKDSNLDYFKAFEEIAEEEHANFTGNDLERTLFVASGTSFGI